MRKPRIEAYHFGSMTIDGRQYKTDLIIYPDGRIRENWWRGNGHRLVPDDIESVLAAGTKTLVIGTGASGMMRVTRSVTEECKRRGIEVAAGRTGEAVEQYNATAGEAVAACFHLTC